MGSAAAWAATVILAVLVNSMYVPLVLVLGAPSFFTPGMKDPSWGNKSVQENIHDLAQVFLFVGASSALAAATVALLAGALIGLPWYLSSSVLRHGSPRLYARAGFRVALILAAILTATNLFSFLSMFMLPVAAILIAGPVAALTFRAVVQKLEHGTRLLNAMIVLGVALEVLGILSGLAWALRFAMPS